MSDSNRKESSFTGSFGAFFAQCVLWGLFTVVTLGFGWAYAYKRITCWLSDRAAISGRQLVFTGTARNLFVRMLFIVIAGFGLGFILMAAIRSLTGSFPVVFLWIAFVALDIGFFYAIYRFIFIEWFINQLSFVDEEKPSAFTGSFGKMVLYMIAYMAVSFLTFGFGIPWALALLGGWVIGNTVISGHPLHFKGQVREFIKTHRLLSVLFILIVLFNIGYVMTNINLYKDMMSNIEVINNNFTTLAEHGGEEEVYNSVASSMMAYHPSGWLGFLSVVMSLLGFYVAFKFYVWMFLRTSVRSKLSD